MSSGATPASRRTMRSSRSLRHGIHVLTARIGGGGRPAHRRRLLSQFILRDGLINRMAFFRRPQQKLG